MRTAHSAVDEEGEVGDEGGVRELEGEGGLRAPAGVGVGEVGGDAGGGEAAEDEGLHPERRDGGLPRAGFGYLSRPGKEGIPIGRVAHKSAKDLSKYLRSEYSKVENHRCVEPSCDACAAESIWQKRQRPQWRAK